MKTVHEATEYLSSTHNASELDKKAMQRAEWYYTNNKYRAKDINDFEVIISKQNWNTFGVPSNAKGATLGFITTNNIVEVQVYWTMETKGNSGVLDL